MNGQDAPHILTGIKELGDQWFSANITSRRDFPIEKMFKCIETNFKPGRALEKLSLENWRWEKQLNLSPDNASPEKVLEKRIAGLPDPNTTWTNQMPAASGYFGSGGRKRSIDLAFKSGGSSYVFYELKVLPESGNAFEAAIELIGYGLLYIYSRENLAAYKESPLMKASSVELGVLGTWDYYQKQLGKQFGPTKELQNCISQSLSKLAAAHINECEMKFCFYTFPSDFAWSSSETDLSKLQSAVDRIHPFFG